MLIINYLFLLFGLQLTKSKCLPVKLFLTINWINLLITFILTLTSCIFISTTPNQLIILITIIFNFITQLYLYIKSESLIKLQSDIISNISSKSIKTIKKISIILTLVIIILLTIETIKSTLLLISIGPKSYTINFYPCLQKLITLIFPSTIKQSRSTNEIENNPQNVINNFPSENIQLIILIALNFHSTIIQLSWFLISLSGYIHFYLSINYLNQSLHNYAKRMLTKYYKMGDLTSLVFAHRKVYNMKVKFNSIMTIIPFIWWLQLFLTINITLGDLLITTDREIEITIYYIIPTLGIMLIVLIAFTFLITIYQSKDFETIKRITRLICIETTRCESIEKLIAFLTEIQLFPTINLTLANLIPFNCWIIFVFLLITINCIALWLILTPYGQIIINSSTNSDNNNNNIFNNN